jgi:DNA-binding response OmpR family regulator
VSTLSPNDPTENPLTSKSDPQEKRAILIVEDSEDFSNLMKFVIEDMGFEGVQFPLEEDDIVKWAVDTRAVVILMDLALRKKGGMAFIEDLKSHTVTKHIPIIIISGRDLSQKEVVALQMKGVRYLRKGRTEMVEIKSAITHAASAAKASHFPKVK